MNQQRAWRIAMMSALVQAITSTGWAQERPGSFADLKAYHERARDAIQNRMDGIKAEDERRAIKAEVWDEVRLAARRAFAWSGAHPDDPEAIDAIVWTVHGLANGYYPEKAAETAQAYVLLKERGLASEKVVPVCFYAAGAGYACPEARQFLETALERSPNRLIRGAACLGLARDDALVARLARRLRDPLTRDPFVTSWAGTGVVEKLERTDPEQADRRAEGYFERVMADFGDLSMPPPYSPTPFGRLAEGELFGLRHLGVGKIAPEIDGEEMRGPKLRLGDHRGKVVVLVFWATWCGPCMAMVPDERDLVKRMGGNRSSCSASTATMIEPRPSKL